MENKQQYEEVVSGYQSEAQLEELLVKDLVRKGYERVSIPDSEELERNFRNMLYKFNQDKLNGKPFSDKEFEKVLLHIEGKSIYQSAKNLRDQMVLTIEDKQRKLIITTIQKLAHAVNSKRHEKVMEIYKDPTCGSGGLLLETKMNMIIHNIPYTNFNIVNTDTLERPSHMDKTYSVQVANPPLSTNHYMSEYFRCNE